MVGTIGCAARSSATRFVELLRTTPSRRSARTSTRSRTPTGARSRPPATTATCSPPSGTWRRPGSSRTSTTSSREVRAWIARDGLESTVLNTGNLSDSLAFERERPLAARARRAVPGRSGAEGPAARAAAGHQGRPRRRRAARRPRAVVERHRVVLAQRSRRRRRPRARCPVRRRAPRAARSLKAAGWRVRIRIDPMIAGHSVRGPRGAGRGLAPERVTLGCLRAERRLLRRATGSSRPWIRSGSRTVSPGTPSPTGSACTASVIDALSDRVPVGLCEETEEAWTAVGLDPESKTCNCAT